MPKVSDRIWFLSVLVSIVVESCLLRPDTSERAKDQKIDLRIIDTLSYRYLPLETKHESLFGEVMQILIDENYIFLLTGGEGQSVLVFDMEGRFLTRVSRSGRGPGEYGGSVEIDLDRKRKQILVYDQGGKKILRFGYDGTYQSELSLPDYMGTNFAFLTENRFAFHRGLGRNQGFYLNITDSLGNTIETHNPVNPFFEDMIQSIPNIFFSRSQKNGVFYIPIWSDQMYQLTQEGCRMVKDFNMSHVMISTIEDKSRRSSGLETGKFDYFSRCFVNDKGQYIVNIAFNSRLLHFIGNLGNGSSTGGSFSFSERNEFINYGFGLFGEVKGHHQDHFVKIIDAASLKRLYPTRFRDLNDEDNPIIFFFRINI